MVAFISKSVPLDISLLTAASYSLLIYVKANLAFRWPESQDALPSANRFRVGPFSLVPTACHFSDVVRPRAKLDMENWMGRIVIVGPMLFHEAAMTLRA